MVRKSIFLFSLIILTFLLGSSAQAQVSVYCEGATTNFTCDSKFTNITESCTMKGNITTVAGSSCFGVPGNLAYDTVINCDGYAIIGDDSGGTDGFFIYPGGQRIMIKNCLIQDFEHGIHSEGSQTTGLFNNTVFSNEVGVYFINANQHNISFNTAYDNRRTGFHVDSSSTNLDFYENIAHDNGDTGAYLSTASFGIDFVDNILYNNRYGVTVYQTDGAKFLRNNFSFNTEHNIRLVESKGNNFTENIIDNAQYGIYILQNSTENLFDKNDITNSEYDGIYSNASSYNNFTNNYIYNSSIDSAIWLDDDSNYNLIEENVLESGIYGVAIYNTVSTVESNIVRENEISNFTSGVYLLGAYYNTISDNIFSNNTGGIDIENSENNNITNNDISAGDYGVYAFGNSINNLIRGNKIYDLNNYGGIYIDTPATLNVVDNNEIYNCPNGIYIYSYENNVTDNKIHDTIYGIYLHSSNDNIIVENQITNNDYGVYLYVSIDEFLDKNLLFGNDYGIYIPRVSVGICKAYSALCNLVGTPELCESTRGCTWFGGFCRSAFCFHRDSYSCNSDWDCYWDGTTYYSNNINITNNKISGGIIGAFLQGFKLNGGNHLFYNNQISGSTTGLQINNSQGSNISNLKLYNNGVDLKSYGSDNDPLINITFGGTSTDINFSTYNLEINEESMKGSAPNGMGQIGKFVEIKNISGSIEINLTMYYSDSDVNRVETEDSLKLYKYTTKWVEITHTQNNTDNSMRALSLTSFSSFGIFGKVEEESSEGRTSSGFLAICGNGKCEYTETYLNCAKDCPAPSNPPENVTEDLGDITQGKTLEMSTGKSLSFNIKGEKHTLQLNGITENSINVWIWSEPMLVSLNVGETKLLDLDKNGLSDFEIILDSIINQKAAFTIREIEEIQEQEEIFEEIEEKPKISIWPIIMVICVLLILTAVVILKTKHKKKKKYYGYK